VLAYTHVGHAKAAPFLYVGEKRDNLAAKAAEHYAGFIFFAHDPALSC
jgi:hypothetical protein